MLTVRFKNGRSLGKVEEAFAATLMPRDTFFFAGLTLEQAAECLDISPSTADRSWRYARAWLYDAMAGNESGKN